MSRSQRVEKALRRRIADLEEELALSRASHEEDLAVLRRLIFTQEQPLRCRSCGGLCEEDRRCYAQPTCHACLPPPPPLEVLVVGESEVSS